MADITLLERARSRDRRLVIERNNAENRKQFDVPELVRFSEHLETGQFMEYFYPWEKIYLKTNNFEKYFPRTHKTNKFFHKDIELKEYILDMSNPSSNNEDRPPPSEELFFESDVQQAYDKIFEYTRFTPRITLLQSSLLRDLDHYVILPEDDQHLVRQKQQRRLELIRGYCKELKRKRFAKTFQRFTKVRAKKQSVGMEAMELLEREMVDKNLMRYDYYNRDEPSEFKTILLEARKKALTTKYMQYITDPRYRRMYRDRIYYNVNKDVPENDRLHMHGSVMLVGADEAEDPTMDPEITEAVRLMSRSPKKRRNIRNKIEDSMYPVMHENELNESLVMRKRALPKSRQHYLAELNDELLESGKKSLFQSQSAHPPDIPTSEAEFISDLESLHREQIPVRESDKKRHLLEAIVRYRQVKEELKTHSPADEAQRLAELEVQGKQLEKIPTSSIDLHWRNKRIKAIKRKCNRYAQDPDFRHRYAQRMETSFHGASPKSSPVDSPLRMRGGVNQANLNDTPVYDYKNSKLTWTRNKKVVRNKMFEFPHEGGAVNVMYAEDVRAKDGGYIFDIHDTTKPPQRYEKTSNKGILTKMSESILYESPTARGMVSLTTNEVHGNMHTPEILHDMESSENQAAYPITEASDEFYNDPEPQELYNNEGISTPIGIAHYTNQSYKKPRNLNYSQVETQDEIYNEEEEDMKAQDRQIAMLSSRIHDPMQDLSILDESHLDVYIPEQPDSDIPTSEAEFMSDFEFGYSPRHARRNRRRLRALERFTSVASLKLETPQQECETLLQQELADKGLSNVAHHQEQDKHEAKILAKRRRSIQRKYDEYARDENFRQQYKQRVISGAFLAEQFNDIDQVRGGSPMPTGVLSPPPFERDPYTSTPIVKALTRSVTNIEENESTQSSIDEKTDDEGPSEYVENELQSEIGNEEQITEFEEEEPTNYEESQTNQLNTTYDIEANSETAMDSTFDLPEPSILPDSVYTSDKMSTLADSAEEIDDEPIVEEENIFIGNRVVQREQAMSPNLRATKLDETSIPSDLNEDNTIEPVVHDGKAESSDDSSWLKRPKMTLTDPDGDEFQDDGVGDPDLEYREFDSTLKPNEIIRSTKWVKASELPQFVPVDETLQNEQLVFWQEKSALEKPSTIRKQWDIQSQKSIQNASQQEAAAWAQKAPRKQWTNPKPIPAADSSLLNSPKWTKKLTPQPISSQDHQSIQQVPSSFEEHQLNVSLESDVPVDDDELVLDHNLPATPTTTWYQRQDDTAGPSVAVDSEVENVAALNKMTRQQYAEYSQLNTSRNTFHSGLTTYANVSTAESSFDEEVPASELEQMSDVNLDIIDAAVANYENKPISRNKIELFIKLSKLEEEEVSYPEHINEIRNCFVRYHHACREKRIRKDGLDRLLQAMSRDEHPIAEGLNLEIAETDGKQLNRSNYYAENEPKELTDLLLKRQTAIKRKFQQYGTNESFRKEYRNRVMTGLYDKIDLCAKIQNIPITSDVQSTPKKQR